MYNWQRFCLILQVASYLFPKLCKIILVLRVPTYQLLYIIPEQMKFCSKVFSYTDNISAGYMYVFFYKFLHFQFQLKSLIHQELILYRVIDVGIIFILLHVDISLYLLCLLKMIRFLQVMFLPLFKISDGYSCMYSHLVRLFYFIDLHVWFCANTILIFITLSL